LGRNRFHIVTDALDFVESQLMHIAGVMFVVVWQTISVVLLPSGYPVLANIGAERDVVDSKSAKFPKALYTVQSHPYACSVAASAGGKHALISRS
jgi:hypothetical protein